MKYAIKVQMGFPHENDWLYLVSASSIDQIRTFDTKQEAETAAKIFKNSKIVEYNENE